MALTLITGGVGADQSDFVFSGHGYHLAFQFSAVPACFPESARQNDRTLNPILAAIFQYCRQGCGRGGHQGHIHRTFDIRNLFITFKSQDTFLLGVYGIDSALVFFIQQGPDRLISALGFIFGSTDNGN